MSFFIKNIFLVQLCLILAILYPTSLVNLVVEVGTRHSHQTLLRNTDRPCRFAFIPHFICVTICIFLSLTVLENSQRMYTDLGDRQRPLNKTCRYGDATTFTCDVIMVLVVTRAPNITNISCWKIAPKPLVYIDPRILLNYYTFTPGKTI